MIKISIDLLVKCIGASLLILVILSIYMLFNSIRSKVAAEKIETYLRNNQELWYRYLNDEIALPLQLIPNNDVEIQAIEKIFFAYTGNISNPAIKEKIRNFSNQYLKQYYSRLLLSRKWSLRVNTLYRISGFGIDSLFAECKELGKKRKLSPEERFGLLFIYSMFDREGFIEEFANLSIELSEYEYKKLLISFKPEVLERLTHKVNEFPLVYQYYFIDVLGMRRNFNFLPFLENNLNHENPEIRIRSLKAIGEIGAATDLDKYKSFVRAPEWEERLMLAKLLCAFPLERAYPLLEQLLQDKNWWVRSNAAKTIINSKDGKAKLETFIANSKDQYAIEAACEVLAGEA
jgi:hypothetical protein